MPQDSPSLTELIGQVVVVDLISTYVCLGVLTGVDPLFLELRDADLHDFRHGAATREVYVYESATLGIRKNRSRVLLRLADVVAISRLSEVAAD
ncbi:hypothetical protein [Paludisphaera sp.]|uniref:hypothetical protein n=1 Tax=Paludisphaera sp. TaxID=2017432 RepID=UPI00301DB6FE